MSKQAHTVSEEGFTSTSAIRDFEVTIDPAGEAAPDTLELLLADYAACSVPAFRVGARQRGIDDLGRLEIEVSGALNDDDKLESIAFDVAVAADIDETTGEEILERVRALCKVHDALKESLHAEMSIRGNAF